MKIGLLNSNCNFKGRVNLDKRKIAENISFCPKETHESLIGNIITLKHRLENLTPDYKVFDLDFQYDFQYLRYNPNESYGIIKVKDEAQNSYKNCFFLGKNSGTTSNDFADGETIWQKGFKEITEKAAYVEYPKSKLQETTQVSKEINEIASQIESREERIKFDKNQIAIAIFNVSKDCPEEIKLSLIGNINTLTKRMENSTSKEKNYNITVTGKKDENWDAYYFEVRIDAVDTAFEYFEKYIVIRSRRNNYKCKINGEDIWQRMFKPLTAKVLWDGYHHLPFENSQEKYAIFKQLMQ